MENLNRCQFFEMFGVRLQAPLTTAESDRCNQINALFDDMKDAFGLESFAIFCEALGEYAYEAHSSFLRDVRACDEKVLHFCQQELALNTARREAFKQKKKECEAKKNAPILPPQSTT
jgi:hypothetical protein